ncbi:MAG: HD domain-containing protein [Candidatus Thermoplasmatota archaeon]
MNITDPISILKNVNFHKYNAKSNGESLLIHSYNTYFLTNKIATYITGISEEDRIKIKIASLLHDYGKTSAEFQRKLRGPHKLRSEDIPRIKEIITENIYDIKESDVEDIIYIIQNHHSIDLNKATNNRQRLTRIISICDNVVSNEDLTDEIIYSLNTLIDSTEYEFITVELMEHPISSYLIGAFDFVYKKNGIEPILFVKNGTLFIKKKNQSLPPLSEINKKINEKITSLTFEGQGTIKLDNTNNRIYTNPEHFLKLASHVDKFLEEVTQEVDRRLANFKKYQKERWNERVEKIYLYGRVCGWIHDSIIELCKIKNEEPIPKNRGGFADKNSVKFIEKKYGKGKSFTVITRSILERYQLQIKNSLKDGGYDIKDLLITNSPPENPVHIDIQTEAKNDYEKYWQKNPINVCRICHTFKQTSTTAALFPASELGGTTDVFYTDIMRRSPELKQGGGICRWCLLWFTLMKNKTGNKMYKLCVLPHGVFGRIDWDDIFEPEQIIRIGNPREEYFYPHVAIYGLSGQTYSSFISQVMKNNGEGNSILQNLYENGLRSKVISTLVEPSTKLLDCGGVSIDSTIESYESDQIRRKCECRNKTLTEYDLLKIALENVRKSNDFSFVVRSIKFNPYSWGSLIKTKKLKEDVRMIKELGEKTGLSFLDAIWIDGLGEIRVSNAEKTVRRMNETLRKLKDSEGKNEIIDAMIALGIKVAISTRNFKTWQDERKQTEIEAFRKIAEKLYEYKDDSAKRTELVRSMAYYLAYVSKGGMEK